MKCELYKTKEFCIRSENKPGILYKISLVLGENGVNVESISAFADREGKAAFHIVTNDVETARKVLNKVSDVDLIKEDEIIVVKLDNRPGELAKVTEKLHKHSINLKSLYILSTGDKTEVALKPENIEKAIEILEGRV